MPTEFIGFIVAGLVVGFIVGLTGIGGGSLMTPILLWFNIPPAKAVGTDLLYAAITKAGGIYVHNKKKNVDWKLVGLLAAGSVPASLLTLFLLHYLGDTKTINGMIKQGLGFTLTLTAIAIIFKKQILSFAKGHSDDSIHANESNRKLYTWLTGLLLGFLVTLTSVGAGAIGTVALFFLYPLLPTSRLVGTEIAHAVPLTLVAGLGHASVGNMDWELLSYLLMGSLPGIYAGSQLTGKIPDAWLRPAVAGMLLFVGIKLALP